MCTPTIAAAVAPHIPAFIWITGALGAVMLGAALGMFWQRRQDDKAIDRTFRYLRFHPALRRGLEDAAREIA